jgi:hypothetical protein
MSTMWLALLFAVTPLTWGQPLYDTDLARVILARNTPGQKSRLHKHDLNRVMIHLDAGVMRLAFVENGAKDVRFRAGEVRWDPAVGLHTSENIGGTTYRIVEIELKRVKRTRGGGAGFPALDPVHVDPKHYSVEFENGLVRVIRARFEAGYKTPMHEHALPRVVVFLTDFHLKVTTPDGRVTESKGAAGDVLMPGPSRHEEVNLSGGHFEVLAVELK